MQSSAELDVDTGYVVGNFHSPQEVYRSNIIQIGKTRKCKFMRLRKKKNKNKKLIGERIKDPVFREDKTPPPCPGRSLHPWRASVCPRRASQPIVGYLHVGGPWPPAPGICSSSRPWRSWMSGRGGAASTATAPTGPGTLTHHASLLKTNSNKTKRELKGFLMQSVGSYTKKPVLTRI